jgi:26S proteasome regulatory subunit N2
MKDKEVQPSTSAEAPKPEEKKETEEKKTKKKKEENFEVLENMARVVPAQLKHVAFKSDSRYVPIKKGVVGGILLMLDKHPDQPEELIDPSAPTAESSAASGAQDEAPPFEPFEYTFDD